MNKVLEFLKKYRELVSVIITIFSTSVFISGLFEKDNVNIIIAIITLAIISLIVIATNYKLINEIIQSNEETLHRIDKISKLEKIVDKSDKYIKSIGKLNDAFANVHDILRIDKKEEKDFIIAFREFCSQLSLVFKDITGTNCCVCIKVMYVVDSSKNSLSINDLSINDLAAYTLGRDKITHNRDRFENGFEIKHMLSKNTDYETIFKNLSTHKGRMFFSNSLPNIMYYKNTSFLYHEGFQETGYPPKTSVVEKRKSWPLPYKSCIVVPICPTSADDRNPDNLLGFLTVDSDEENVFIKENDSEIIIGCAEGIYNTLFEYLKLKSRHNEEKAE